MNTGLESSPALWNRAYLDLRSEEMIAQILDRGLVADWRELNRRARGDKDLRERIHRVVLNVPLPYGHFWLAALTNLGVQVDWSEPLPPETLGV